MLWVIWTNLPGERQAQTKVSEWVGQFHQFSWNTSQTIPWLVLFPPTKATSLTAAPFDDYSTCRPHKTHSALLHVRNKSNGLLKQTKQPLLSPLISVWKPFFLSDSEQKAAVELAACCNYNSCCFKAACSFRPLAFIYWHALVVTRRHFIYPNRVLPLTSIFTETA